MLNSLFVTYRPKASSSSSSVSERTPGWAGLKKKKDPAASQQGRQTCSGFTLKSWRAIRCLLTQRMVCVDTSKLSRTVTVYLVSRCLSRNLRAGINILPTVGRWQRVGAMEWSSSAARNAFAHSVVCVCVYRSATLQKIWAANPENQQHVYKNNVSHTHTHFIHLSCLPSVPLCFPLTSLICLTHKSKALWEKEKSRTSFLNDGSKGDSVRK